MESPGFKAGSASPCCVVRERDGVACVVYVDDLTFEGPEEGRRSIPEDVRKLV